MDDTAIKKGLECCSNDIARDCANCPYEYIDRCDLVLGKDALDLIERLTNSSKCIITVNKKEVKNEKNFFLDAWNYICYNCRCSGFSNKDRLARPNICIGRGDHKFSRMFWLGLGRSKQAGGR